MRLDRDKFHQALSRNRIKSVLDLSRRTGLHRNTINHYLAGGPVYQKGYQLIAAALNVSPTELTHQEDKLERLPSEIAVVIDEISLRFSKLAFVLFGSRAKGRAKRFSDWDIGFFSDKTISHQTHLDVLAFADDLMEKKIDTLDLVNLNAAPRDFLIANKNDFVFLTGRISDWLTFKRRLFDDERPKRKKIP